MQEVEFFQLEKRRFFLIVHLHRGHGYKRIKRGNAIREKQILQRRVCFPAVQGLKKALKTVVIMPKRAALKIGNEAQDAV